MAAWYMPGCSWFGALVNEKPSNQTHAMNGHSETEMSIMRFPGKVESSKRPLAPATLHGLAFCVALLASASGYGKGHSMAYSLGEKSYIESLFPLTVPAATGAACQPKTIADSIQCYTAQSLARDGIKANVSVHLVKEGGQQVYRVKLDSTDPRASSYAKLQPTWLAPGLAGQALKGVSACQKAGTSCWKPNPDTSTKGGITSRR